MSDHSATGSRGYMVDVSQVGSALKDRFLQLAADAETETFIAEARGRPHSPVQTWLHRTLRGFLSDYDINGLLGMYPMHLLSTPQWATLLADVPRQTLLDVGAGDGGLTRHLAPLFKATTTTECSWAMARRLRRAGYDCIQEDVGARINTSAYDCVACMNVLDRTAYPLRLLTAMNQLRSPAGAMVLATPLPLDAFYYRGPSTRTPRERLHAPGPSFERAATQFVRTINAHLPTLELRMWTRIPYLSWGDARRSLYELDDFVGVWVSAR